jgi:hypothetical protein
VKQLKLVIALCAAVGLLELVVPVAGDSWLGRLYDASPREAVVYAAVFVLPLMMSVTALVRPPLLAWQGGVALAGFVLGVVRFRVWDSASQLGDDLHVLLRVVALVVGTLAAVAALLRPEAPATS